MICRSFKTFRFHTTLFLNRKSILSFAHRNLLFSFWLFGFWLWSFCFHGYLHARAETWKDVQTRLRVTPVQESTPVTLSEVMFDAAGSESTDEFIEIYNLSDTDSVNLSEWQVGDGRGSDIFIDAGYGLILTPGQFGLIFDPDYFGNSTAYDDLIPADALVLTISGSTLGSAGLSNSTPETIMLFDASGDTVDIYTYSVGNPPGYSDEKSDLIQSNTPENWSDSHQYLGTPGARNSVSPVDVDIELTRLFSTPLKPQADDEVQLHLIACNCGREVIPQFSVKVFEDSSGDGNFSPEELLHELLFQQLLLPEDSVEVIVTLGLLSPGRHYYLAELGMSEDENSTNNCDSLIVSIPFPLNCLVINEIMYDPLSGHSEWIELCNPSTEPVGIQNWYLSDLDTSRAVMLSFSPLQLSPQDFCVLARDSSIYFQYPNLPSTAVILMSAFPSLNNDADVVHLIDLTSNVVDRVPYLSSWGGGDGVSLEKINPSIGGMDSTNWSSCVLAQGATPGEQNSIFVEHLPEDATLSLHPNPFSPDGDGYEDFVIISYQLPMTTAFVNLKIFDARGRLVRELFNCEPSGSSRQVVWDGCGDDNQKLRMGIYVVYLEALNGHHGILKTVKKALVLAGRL